MLKHGLQAAWRCAFGAADSYENMIAPPGAVDKANTGNWLKNMAQQDVICYNTPMKGGDSMDQRKQRLWSGQAVTLTTLLLAAGLIAGAVCIYMSGSYTREKATGALAAIMPLFVLWVAAILWGKQVWPRASKRENKVLRAEHTAPGWVRTTLYVLALGFLVAGVMNGGMRDVLIKAINICTECIGLG